jgi:hypothetical protein
LIVRLNAHHDAGHCLEHYQRGDAELPATTVGRSMGDHPALPLFSKGRRVVKRLRHRIPFGVDSAEEFDFSFRPFEEVVGLPEQFDSFFVAFHRLVDDLFEPFERLLEGGRIAVFLFDTFLCHFSFLRSVLVHY